MKRFLTYALVVLLATACYNDDELKSRLDDVDQRLTKVETLVSSLNTQLTKLQELIAGKQFISNIEDKEDGTHVITFVNSYGEMSTMTLKDGSRRKRRSNPRHLGEAGSGRKMVLDSKRRVAAGL